MLDFLPNHLKNHLKQLNMRYLYEIRLRADKPICVNYQGNYHFLGQYGVTDIIERAIVCQQDDIETCIYNAGANSVYSVEEQIKQGFLTAKDGERLGIAGEYVFDHGQPLSIRNFSSICIRVPHEVLNCGDVIYNICMSDRILNVLLMSRPGMGKTTILRDLARKISKRYKYNVLLCDERGELSIGDIGNTCDVLRYSNKSVAFETGIRALRPDVIITDEMSIADCEAAKKAVQSGIFLLASVHCSDFQLLPQVFLGLFDFFVLLDSKTIGKVSKIYDKTGKEVFDCG